MREITSATNPIIKVFRGALREGVTRDGWVAVEGPLLVEEALRAAAPDHNGRALRSRSAVRTLLVARSASAKLRDLLARLPDAAEAVTVPDPLFERVAATVTPQGVAALVEILPPALGVILGAEDTLLMAALGVQDPGNLGTILRTADALGASAVVTLKTTASPFNPKVVRSSGGAVFRLPMFASVDSAFFERLRGAGIRLVAAKTHDAPSVEEADLGGRLALLVGNEAAGLPADIRPDLCVRIPLRPGVDSLNAAVAAGILLYEAARQRGFKY